MEWQTTYLGQADIAHLSLDEQPRALPDLSDDVQATAKDIRKAKKGEAPMTVSASPDSIQCKPLESSGTAIYQPIGKVLFVHAFSEGTLMKSHYFAYVAVSEDTRVGGPGAKYQCHLFKCKSDEDANAVCFAIKRTMSGAQHRGAGGAALKTLEQLEAAVKWWNNNTPPLLHYNVNKELVVAGNMKVQCQVDASLKTATKMVRLTTNIIDDKLVELLAEKFNLSNVDSSQYAVYDRRDSGEQIMLEAGESPLLASLRWRDPSEGAIWLQRLPSGLVRVNTKHAGAPATPAASNDMPRQGSGHKADTSKDTKAFASSTSASAATATATTDTHASPPASASAASAPVPLAAATTTSASSSSLPLASPTLPPATAPAAAPAPHDAHATPSAGPLLPYSPEDEDLLLSVMIARQSGTGLGFKLTPAYLLQMCIAYCGLNLGEASLRRLLGKVVSQIGSVVANNPGNPDMLLFWLCNSLKLASSLAKDSAVSGVFQETARANLDTVIDTALKHLKACAATGQPLPAAIERSEWSSQAELKTVIVEHYRALDANMNADSLNEVVQRITQAMPSPARKPGSQADSPAPAAPAAATRTPSVPANAAPANGGPSLLSPDQGPITSTPVNAGPANLGGDISAIQAPARADNDHSLLRVRPNGLEGVDMTNIPKNTRSQSPLPAEWEELIDQETQHRFFANHVTRQTSWTDPRDRLTTVTLIKGERGLGLGISGAKRTWDDRLVLGIFVSSLVPGSAAAVEGTLREGDEVLEVNGHSLIGVSREGAIEFLKQVRQGEKVTMLVAQEPVQKVALKQTAL